MDSDLRSLAETRLTAAAESLALTDPRPAYRERLRMLRQHDAAAFERAIAHYESHVLPALTGGDPLGAWLDYGKFLAGLTGAAELRVVDDTGAARAFDAPLRPGSLAIFVPEDAAVPVLVGTMPVRPSPAQQATLQLLLPDAAPDA